MPRRTLLALACVLCCAWPAIAQDRLWFFFGGGRDGTMVKQVDVTDGGRTWNTTRTWTVSAGYPVGSRAVLIGGRYLVWLAGTPDPVTRLAYLDTRTGQHGAFGSFGVPSGLFGPSIGADRQSGRLFVFAASVLWVLNPWDGSFKLIPIPEQLGTWPVVQAAAGRVFLSGRAHAFAAPELIVIDPDSGRRLASYPNAWRVEFTRDETFFYLLTAGSLSRHVTNSLARVSEVAFEYPTDTTLIDSVRLRRSAEGWLVYDADARSVIGTALPGMFSGRGVEFWRPGARSPLYVTSYRSNNYFDFDYRVDVIDPSLAVIAQTMPGLGSPQAMMSVPEAPAPVANVSNHTVTITWDAVEHAGEYRLEAGFRPGASDIGTFNIGSSRAVTMPNVPRGTYYVRVRARNELGVSAPSADVRVDVP